MKNIQQDRVSILLSRTKAGEESAFFEIAEQYKPLIESCVCYFNSKLPHEELQQEALIALYRAACSYDPDVSNVSFGLYAKICINNSLISLSRNVAKYESVAIDDYEIDSDVNVDLDPSVDYINRESFIKLDKFVRDHLSSYEYSVFRLYLDGYRVKEIASILSKTEKSVTGAIMRLKIKLRSSLKNSDL